MRHKHWKNGPGTNRRTDLALRPASRIGRNHWHQRKRQQTILVPVKHDWETIMLQGAAMQEIYERRRKKGQPTLSKGKLFRRINEIKEK